MKKKIGNFFKKIGHFFKVIGKFIAKIFVISYNFVKDNFWIQPIVIVGLIFALVFAFQSIINNFENISSTISGWFNPNKEEEALYTPITMEEIYQKMDAGEDFVFYIGSSTCSACTLYHSVLNKYLSTNPDKTIYYLTVDKNDDNSFVDYTLTTDDIDEILERMNNITFREDLGNVTSLSTPTTIVVRDGEFADAQIGAIGLQDVSDYLDFVEFVQGEQIPN